MDVSAIFVDKMHFLIPNGAISKTLSCLSTDNVLCNGNTIHFFDN